MFKNIVHNFSSKFISLILILSFFTPNFLQFIYAQTNEYRFNEYKFKEYEFTEYIFNEYEFNEYVFKEFVIFEEGVCNLEAQYGTKIDFTLEYGYASEEELYSVKQFDWTIDNKKLITEGAYILVEMVFATVTGSFVLLLNDYALQATGFIAGALISSVTQYVTTGEIALEKTISDGAAGGAIVAIATSLPSITRGISNFFTRSSDTLISNVAKKTSRGTINQLNDYIRLPTNYGKWKGEIGNSLWIPNSDNIPSLYNPSNKTWEEILKQYQKKRIPFFDDFFNRNGILFRNGFPDFDNISLYTVKIERFSDFREDNMVQADILLSKILKIPSEDARKFRENNSLSWHEHQDMETMQLVPRIIHNNIPHVGGISIYKRINGLR